MINLELTKSETIQLQCAVIEYRSKLIDLSESLDDENITTNKLQKKIDNLSSLAHILITSV